MNNIVKRSLPPCAAAGVVAAVLFVAAVPAFATGLHSCESEPRSEWVSKETLEANLTEQGWQVRRIKEDGNC